MRGKRWAARLGPALLLALPVAALCVAGGFDGLYGQDPFYYYDYAIGPARASVMALRPLPPFFWPPGYPWLVALASLVVGITALAGQGVSLVMGAVVVVFTGLLAEEVWGRLSGATLVAKSSSPPGPLSWPQRASARARRGGVVVSGVNVRPSTSSGLLVPLAAALLVACHPQLWQSSAVVMADTTGLAAATLGAWALARYARVRRGPWLMVAAAGLAFAILARWIYGLAAVAGGVYALSLLLRREVEPDSPPAWRAWLQALAAIGVAAIILSPLLAKAAPGLTAPTVESAPFAGSFEVYAWHPLNALRREFTTTDGLLSYRLPNGLYYALAPAHRYYFTPLLAALLLPGAWTALTHGRRALGWLLLWAGLVYAFHAGAPWQNFRFTLAYLPPLAVLAAVGLKTVLDWLGVRWRGVALAVFGLGLAVMLFSAAQLTQSFIERKQADLATVRQVEALLPQGARLLTFNMTFTFQHYSVLETHELFYLSAADLPALLADGRSTFLLVDEANIEGQWGDEPLGATYRWLRDERGLEELAVFGSLTLARVVGD